MWGVRGTRGRAKSKGAKFGVVLDTMLLERFANEEASVTGALVPLE